MVRALAVETWSASIRTEPGPVAMSPAMAAGAHTPGMDLPWDRPPATPTNGSRGRVEVGCDAAASRALDRLARRTGTDPVTVVATGLAGVLFRWTGAEEVALGFTAALAPAPDDGPGLALLRLPADADETFDGLSGRVVGAASVEGTADAEPQVLCGGGPTPASWPGQLCVALVDAGARRFEWTYRTDLFDEATVRRLAGQLTTLLVAAAEDPAGRLATLPMLGADERRLVLEEWAGHVEPAPSTTVHAMVAAQCERRPDDVAVEFGDRRLLYRNLEDEVATLAGLLAERGARPGGLVGIALERSDVMVVAVLAVLRCGSAYVPLDPAYPASRLGFMLTDSAASVLVTTSDVRAALAGVVPAGVAVVEVDTEAGAVDRASPLPADRGHPDDLAYVIYTSGSTGRPKGVMVSHRALGNLLDSMGREPGFCADDSLLAVTTLSFDIAGLEILLPLVRGGRLVVAPRPMTVDPQALAEELDRRDVTVMQATPATWRMLVEWGWPGRPGMRALCGGEPLSRSLAADLIRRGLDLWNMYGPTETTIWSTVAHVGDDAGPITIGRPIANTEVLVVDANRVPVPVGVVGELLIGGVGLAGGYLGRPELTRDRFVPHPLGGDSTVYRTGDLVRWRPDGTLSCLGRIDHQVKIHGHRVELGEIEAALSRHPSVADCVVVAADDGHDGKRLVAYVAGRPPAAVDELELRRAVAGSLPGYMVPSVVVSLPALPRTPNGKVDRAALPPAVDRHRAGADGRAVAPRTEMEARLAQLWEEVLGVAPIGVTDDFFELGVDSLTAARLFARIEREFGRRLPFAPVFAAPSIEALAAMLVDGDPEARRFSALVPIHVGGGRVPVFGVHGGAGTILLYHELARRLGPDQPFYGLQAVGLHGDEAPQTTIAAMAGRYVKEIRDIRPHGPYVLVGYCFGGLVAFEMGRLLESAGEAITLVAMLNAPSPGYIRRFDPVFDGEGALTDDEGALVERARPTEDRSVGGRIRRRLSSQQTLPARAKALTDSARRAVVRTVRYRLAEGRFRMLLILRRPLPDSMRENVAFQRIAARAQAGYDPPPAAFPILVARAAGLYHQDDLGWRPYTTGPVETVEVPGEQRVPRDTMREPHVAQVAAAFERLVRDGQAQGAVGSRADG